MSENVLGKNDNMCPGCGNTYGDDNLCMPSACQWEGVDRPATPSSGVTEGKAESGEPCWLCLGLGGVALHEIWTARRGKPLFTAHEPESDLHHVYPCPACAAQPPVPADDAATVLARLQEQMTALADEYSETAVAHGLSKALALVSAAQQRLADRGQSGGSDEQ